MYHQPTISIPKRNKAQWGDNIWFAEDEAKMAFDLYFENERAFIDHHEEDLLNLADDVEMYPRLSWLFEQFYSSPAIYPEVANDIVHELIAIRQHFSDVKESKQLLFVIDRLLPFFSKAYKGNHIIQCSSD